MNIILFGPPGIGKSTIIGELKLLGQKAIDLEDVYPSRIRFQLPNMLDNTFIGGADLNPKRNYQNSCKVLLYADQDLYNSRRHMRDAMIPEKASQSIHAIDDWMRDVEYSLILQTGNTSAQESAKQLVSLFQKRGGRLQCRSQN